MLEGTVWDQAETRTFVCLPHHNHQVSFEEFLRDAFA